MAIYVNTNISSLFGQRYLRNITNSLNTSYQRLASGFRINSAKDDAAGLQIANRLTAQINGLNQGNRNASDGIALAQTMESGIDEISNMLHKMRTLAVQAANGTNTSEDRVSLNKEAQALLAEIERISNQTTFGGQQILNGSKGLFDNKATLTLQVGANSGDTIALGMVNAHFSKVATIAVANFTLTSANEASKMIKVLDTALKGYNSHRADLGAMQSRLESSIRNQSNISANLADARSRIRDTDYAIESANLAQQSILQQAALSMLMQANQRPHLVLRLLGQ